MTRILCAGLAITLMATAAEARVTRIEISRQEPFAAGQTFGTVGAYEKLVGRFYGELDPAHALNAGIVDIDKAPRNARGRVEYSADFYILKPADMTRGNGALFYDVNNRGNKRALLQFNSAAFTNDPATPEHAGTGFLMRQGFTVVWSGWIPGLPAADNLLRIEVPNAAGLTETVWDEFLFNNKTTTQARLTFKATSTDAGQARLLVRERNADEPAVVPAGQWEFVDARTIRLLPAGTPFRIGAIYQLTYQAADPPVAGIGFAATRDLISFLRHDGADARGTPNPLASAGRLSVARALAHGTSQSGRYLRDFVYRGFNEDESNRIVFDGMNAHVGTGRMFLNHRFAQPNRMTHIAHGFMFYPDVSFPFAYETQTDPFTGKSDGILARCTARGNCPKVIHTVTATEYWQSGQSLITTDAASRRDGTPPDNVRIYHLAGTHHIGAGATMPKGVCRRPQAAIPASPTKRWSRWPLRPPRSPVSRRRKHRPRARGSITVRTSTRASFARCRFFLRTRSACWCRRSMPTATRSPASACRISRSRPRPPPGGRCAARIPAAPASCAISTARSSRSPRPRPSARPMGTGAPRWKSAIATARTTPPRCVTRPRRSNAKDIF